uniref:Uncharacterized protein n=1 Tax=Candidatus Kentrum sp. LFY TaxID=2126342 RepID=A0A450WMM4_9GAMM|nr:MAG: hypothetical protein BECKLFY1418C_GA0070996_10418 [Candidatus Kentron sp. LFY]
MKSSVYIETSIISYPTARHSNDIRSVARQNSTIDWWEKYSQRFEQSPFWRPPHRFGKLRKHYWIPGHYRVEPNSMRITSPLRPLTA